MIPSFEQGTSLPLREFSSKMDRALEDLLSGEGLSPEIFLMPGVPRIRPMLLLLSAHAAQRDVEHLDPNTQKNIQQKIEHVALAGELLHAAILLHDAALGRSKGRRRRLARRLLSGAVGWMGGNALNLRAIELAHQASDSIILSDIMEAMRDVAEARQERREWEDRIPKVEEVIFDIEQNMGTLFSFLCRSGARLSGSTPGTSTHLGRYGFHIGVAWALQEELYRLQKDDFAIFLEDALLRKKPIYALSLTVQDDDHVSDLCLRFLSRSRDLSDEQLCECIYFKELLCRMKERRVFTRTKMRVVQSVFSAKRALHRLPKTAHRDALEELAQAFLSQH